MQTEDFLFDNCGQGQVVEQVSEVLPHVGVAVLAQALVVEPVHLRDLPRLVIASQYGDSVLVTYLQTDQQSHGLHWVITSVHIVTHEQVVRVWRLTAYIYTS